MCNCNQKRNSYLPKVNSNIKGMVRVKLIQDLPMVINGDITGRMYIFKNNSEPIWMDKRDSISLYNKSEFLILV
jgi:hypothetical protein